MGKYTKFLNESLIKSVGDIDSLISKIADNQSEYKGKIIRIKIQGESPFEDIPITMMTPGSTDALGTYQHLSNVLRHHLDINGKVSYKVEQKINEYMGPDALGAEAEIGKKPWAGSGTRAY